MVVLVVVVGLRSFMHLYSVVGQTVPSTPRACSASLAVELFGVVSFWVMSTGTWLLLFGASTAAYG